MVPIINHRALAVKQEISQRIGNACRNSNPEYHPAVEQRRWRICVEIKTCMIGKIPCIEFPLGDPNERQQKNQPGEEPYAHGCERKRYVL